MEINLKGINKKAIRHSLTKEELNDLILESMGFYVDDDGVVYNDEMYKVIVRGKALVLKEDNKINKRYEIKFDPIGNPSLMDKLFKFYLEKDSIETGVDVKMISYGPTKRGYRSYLEVVKEDDTKYNSGYYYNDCIKCASIILKMNSDLDEYNLKKLDDELYNQLLKEENKRMRRG